MEITLGTLRKLTTNKAHTVGLIRKQEKPFGAERAGLAGVIEGLETCEISVTAHLEIKAPNRRYTLYCLDMRRQTALTKCFAHGPRGVDLSKGAAPTSVEDANESEDVFHE
jgi:hypothetical protein